MKSFILDDSQIILRWMKPIPIERENFSINIIWLKYNSFWRRTGKWIDWILMKQSRGMSRCISFTDLSKPWRREETSETSALNKMIDLIFSLFLNLGLPFNNNNMNQSITQRKPREEVSPGTQWKRHTYWKIPKILTSIKNSF